MTEGDTDTVFLPRQLDLLNLLGYHHLQHGNPERALVIFDAIHSLRPEDSKVILSLACAQLRCNQPEAAISVLASLPQKNQDDALAWLFRGQALMQTGRVAEGARAMRLFIRKRNIDKI